MPNVWQVWHLLRCAAVPYFALLTFNCSLSYIFINIDKVCMCICVYVWMFKLSRTSCFQLFCDFYVTSIASAAESKIHVALCCCVCCRQTSSALWVTHCLSLFLVCLTLLSSIWSRNQNYLPLATCYMQLCLSPSTSTSAVFRVSFSFIVHACVYMFHSHCHS